METGDVGTESVDEQLGSPGFTLEKGWLAGVALGFVVIVAMVLRNASRKRQNEAPEVGSGGWPSSVPT